MSSNPTGFKIYCGTEYPATRDYYDLDDLFIRKDTFTRGGLWVWGSGLGGQLGNDLTTSRSSPVQTCIRGSRWRKVCLSKHDGHFAIALSSTGQVWGWGCNDTYQLADGTTGDYLCPRRLVAKDNISVISAGGASATAYSPGVDLEQTGYGAPVTAPGHTNGETCRFVWGCVEGCRGGYDSETICSLSSFNNCADVDKKWVDISMGNRFGVGIIDNCITSTQSEDFSAVPGNLVEWGAGRPSACYLDLTRTVYSRNYTGTGLTRISCSTGNGNNTLALSNDYTIEFYTCMTGIINECAQVVFDMRCPFTVSSCPGTYMPSIQIGTTQCLHFQVRLANGTTSFANSTLRLGSERWYHVAASRIGNTTQFYVDGTRYGSICDNFSHANTCITIGADGSNASITGDCYKGSLSNIRIIKGAGIYNGATIDVPKPPLTLVSNATANTSLLLNANSPSAQESLNCYNITDVAATCSLEIFNIESHTTYTLSSDSWKSVSAGNTHAVGLKCDGTLWVWGCNHKGQLGTGDTVDRSRPVQVGTSNNWTAITAGCNFSAAILAGSFKFNAAVLYTWGENTDGQLGINTTTDRSSPTQITSSCTSWKKISGGDSHFAAIQTDGTIWAWGSNQFGELGRGDRVNRSSPVQVLGNTSGWYDVSAGQCATSGLREDAW